VCVWLVGGEEFFAVVEVVFYVAYDLVVFMSFACYEDYVARLS
jgi:hypothetical protein